MSLEFYFYNECGFCLADLNHNESFLLIVHYVR